MGISGFGLAVPVNRGARDRAAAGAPRDGVARGRRRNRNDQGHPSTLGRMQNTGRIVLSLHLSMLKIYIHLIHRSVLLCCSSCARSNADWS